MKQVLFLAIVAALIIGCGPNKTEDVAKTYSIAYNIHLPDTAKDDWEVMHMNFDGSDKKNITNNDDVAWTYIAGKNKLFFISDRDSCYRCHFLYECDPEGKNIRKVSDLRLEDSWMTSRNEGEEMLVGGRIGKAVRYQFFIIDISTGEYRQITTDTAAMYRDPVFSPDGKKIAFSYKKKRRDRSQHEELYVMNEDGSEMKQLTTYPEKIDSTNEFGYKAGAARWHPTENFITYLSHQGGRHSIFAVTPDGSKNWKLIENPKSEGWHDWSSDGKWIVFNSSDFAETQFEITLMNWETKEQKQLTNSEYKSQLGPVFLER